MKSKIVYIISSIYKALAFEWIAEQLNKEKFELSFILLNSGNSELENFLLGKGISVNRIQLNGKKSWPSAFFKIVSYLKKHKPDIIHCHLLDASILGLLAGKLVGIKKRIYTRHHSDYHFRYFPKGIKWDKLCNRMATCIVSPSLAVKEILLNLENVSPQKVSLIHHGFDIDYFDDVSPERIAALKEKYHTKGHYPVVGVISRFTELKGIQYIIPAFERILKSHPTALLLLFNAKGDYETQIKSQLKCLPKSNYRMVSFENDLSAVYKLFDVFVQVSTDRNIEAFGQTYVEALAAGVPSVFTLSGIANEFIVDGENALVVPFKDAEAIYFSIKRILSEPDLREHLKQNGYQSVKENFGLEKMIHQLELLYAG
tara:strand:+ start:1932 stop:3047 length:1116 start_codon:yes stop_codon:yes gene_type:complete